MARDRRGEAVDAALGGCLHRRLCGAPLGQDSLDRGMLRDRGGRRDLVRSGRRRPLDHRRHADAATARLAARDRIGAGMSTPFVPPFAEVIGDPIAQSKSPLIHGFWLDALGLPGRYERRHVTPETLAAYIAERRADPDWRGCNVTIPHKVAVMDLIDDPGNVRGTIGAMNTVVHQPDGSLIGTNTDAAGFYARSEEHTSELQSLMRISYADFRMKK